jgi:hypothetical protein
MPATILHTESYASPGWYDRWSAHIGNESSRLQVGRGSSPQGWAMWNDRVGIDTTSFTVPTAAGPTFGLASAYNMNGIGYNKNILGFFESNGGNLHVQLLVNSAGFLQIKNGSGAVLFTDTTSVVPPSSAYIHIEMTVTVHSSAGTVQLRRNETEILCSLTGVNTRNGGTGVIGHIQVDAAFGAFHTDTIFTAGDGFVGDARVIYSPSDAVGTYTAGVASSGTALSCVDDPPGTNAADSDYITFDDTSLPKASSFNSLNLPASAKTVLAVVPVAVVRKDDAGANAGRLLLISGATEADGGADLAVPSAYQNFRRMHTVDPNTSAAWTIANTNAVQPGWRRTV